MRGSGVLVRELALRLFPALCGIVAIAAPLFLRRDLLSRGAVYVASVLGAISPWLIYHSQTARFYGPLLLFSMLAVLWLLPGPGRRVTLGLCALLAAVFTHPTAVLLGGGWLLFEISQRSKRDWLLPLLLVALVGSGVLFGLGGGQLAEVISDALSRRSLAHYSTGHFLLSVGYNTHGLLLAVLVGFLLALGQRDQKTESSSALIALAWMSVSGSVLLLIFSLLGVSVQARYLMSLVPAFLLLGGWGIYACWKQYHAIAVFVTAVAFLVPLPALQGYGWDGNRHDWRALSSILGAISAEGDIIVADEHALLEDYMRRQGLTGGRDFFEAPLEEEKKMQSFAHNKRDCWIVLKRSRLATGYGSDFMAWVDEHFEVDRRVGRGPGTLVQHDNRLVLYHRRGR